MADNEAPSEAGVGVVADIRARGTSGQWLAIIMRDGTGAVRIASRASSIPVAARASCASRTYTMPPHDNPALS